MLSDSGLAGLRGSCTHGYIHGQISHALPEAATQKTLPPAAGNATTQVQDS